MNVAVLGSGSWGTALTMVLARNGHQVTLLGRNLEEIETLLAKRENTRYLPGFSLPESVKFELLHHDLDPVDMTVIAVPAGAVREVVAEVRGEHPLMVVCAKGLEATTGQTMVQVVREVHPDAEVGVLSGPNLAVEIARGVPAVAVAAFANLDTAELVRDAFSCATYRVSVSDDEVGVEIGGALKNVLAIGAGMSDGLGYGDNTKGAFLSRGLMEMARLGIAMGGRMDTFLGPAGVGDLFATATSRLSRNYRLGHAMGSGASMEQALKVIGQVAEGVPTSEAVMKLALKCDVDLPVFAAVYSVLSGRLETQRAVAMLMDRVASMSQFM